MPSVEPAHYFCWHCGERGSANYGTGEIMDYTESFLCRLCNVTWIMPRRSPWGIYETRERWEANQKKSDAKLMKLYHFEEFVDFTKPGALSCPA